MITPPAYRAYCHGTSGPPSPSVPPAGLGTVKSMIGHAMPAAGIAGLVKAVLAVHHGVLPPTINYETPDPDCDLDYIPNVAREKKVQHVLSNSFGFGGQNISLIVSEFK